MKSLTYFITTSMRELIFGLEDSLVSTLGTITGIAIGTKSTYIVILSGLVLLAAESTSMAAGSYLSNRSANEAEDKLNKSSTKRTRQYPIRGSAVMLVSYLLGGLVPLSPYFFLLPKQAIPLSILMTIITLFFVGYWSAFYTGRSHIKSGLEMMIVSLSAAMIGYGIGYWVSAVYHINV